MHIKLVDIQINDALRPETGLTQRGSVDQQFQKSCCYKILTNDVYEQFKCTDESSSCTDIKLEHCNVNTTVIYQMVPLV